jgi:phosphate-selective porin OprO and OprP
MIWFTLPPFRLSALVCAQGLAGMTPGAGMEIAPTEASGSLVGEWVGKTAADRAWSAATLYKNEAAPCIQLFQLTGRLHLQTFYGEANHQNFDTSSFRDAAHHETVLGNHIEARRARLGFRAKLFHDWKLEGDFNLDLDRENGPGGSFTLYKSLQEASLAYAPSEQFTIALGKRLIRSSRDFEISSNEISTIERNARSNLMNPGELTGIWSLGKKLAGEWHYEFGAFSNARVRDFSQPNDGGILTIAKIGYDLADLVGLQTCDTTLIYINNSEPGHKEGKFDPNYTFVSTPLFSNSLALTNDSSHGKFRWISELTYGGGFSGLADQGTSKPTPIAQPDLFGISLTPSYSVSDRFEAVYRFQLISSSGPDGIHVASRYERLLEGDDEFGNTYIAHYLGLNYFMHGHRFKLMNGVEYSQIGGGTFHGYTALSALRCFF